jgi:hypothetical protein
MKIVAVICTVAMLMAGPVPVAWSDPLPAFYAETGRIEILPGAGQAIRLNDRVFRLSPTVKIVLPNKLAGALSDVKTGNLVGLDFITINNQLLVDRISLLSDL